MGGEISAVAATAALWMPVSMGKVSESVVHGCTESIFPHFLSEITMTYSIIWTGSMHHEKPSSLLCPISLINSEHAHWLLPVCQPHPQELDIQNVRTQKPALQSIFISSALYRLRSQSCKVRRWGSDTMVVWAGSYSLVSRQDQIHIGQLLPLWHSSPDVVVCERISRT